MTQSREDFTVAISTFNRSGLVGYAIDSVLQQDTPVSEIIVVDDASTDNTADLIRARYPNVRYLRQAVNSGPCAARNRALREATNERVVMLDDDDTLLPNALSSITQQIKDGSEIEKYPVLMFGHSGGVIPCEFLILKMSDYVSGVVKGDFLPEAISFFGLFLSRDPQCGGALALVESGREIRDSNLGPKSGPSAFRRTHTADVSTESGSPRVRLCRTSRTYSRRVW
jgi:glycosyltransferase involved in cell wall biosynthesis